MAIDEKWQPARLFPVTGIGNPDEQERRACSVFLAVLQSVSEYARTLTFPLGAFAGPIKTFIEVPFVTGGEQCRPDGLIEVTRGQKTWTALVEVKTGRNDLKVDQVLTYLKVAHEKGYDAVITISRQIPTTPKVHPLGIDKRKIRTVKLHHLSWSQIHTEALFQQSNHMVNNPDQAWLLSEFIRYLEEPKSGALDFEDMGPSWVAVRNGAARQTLRPNDAESLDVVASFDQLVAFCGMQLSRRLGVHVHQRLGQADQANRLQGRVTELASNGRLGGTLVVPNAAVPIDVVIDLRANRVDIKATLAAPLDRRASARVNWLVGQLKAAPTTLHIVANVGRSKSAGKSITLAALIENPKIILEQPNADIRTFTLTLSQPAGTKGGKGQGSFVKSVTSLVDRFHFEVVQPLKAWSPPHPSPR